VNDIRPMELGKTWESSWDTCKINQKLKILVVCDAGFYSVHVARVPSRRDFGASTNQVRSRS